MYGALYMVNDKSIAKWMHNIDKDNPTTGYYLRWFYLEKDASVSGHCQIKTYSGHEGEMFKNRKEYDLNLMKGWNIVKYEINEVFNSESGKVFPSKTTISVIKKLQEDLQWVVM